MTAKKSFSFILRIIFVLCCLQFGKDVLFKWDGYSYYMQFTDFLPDLSLSFILLMIPVVISAFVLWVLLCGLLKVTSKSLTSIRLEHLTGWIVLIVLVIAVIYFFKDISIRNLTGLGDMTNLAIGGILSAVIIWTVRKYIEKILYELNSRITPLVWIFCLTLIIALPFSVICILEKEPPAADRISRSDSLSDEKPPNIILVTWDTLTAMDMGMYNYDRPTTPFLSEWTKDAVVFNRAYSSSPWTTPGAMSLMTGQRSWTHGTWYFAYYSPVKEYPDSLPKLLRDNGYNNYSYIQNSFAHPDTLGMGKYFVVKDRASSFKTFSNKGGIYNLVIFIINKPIVRELIEMHPFIKISKIIKRELRGIRLSKRRKTGNGHRMASTVPSHIIYNRFLEDLSSTVKGNNADKADSLITEPFFVWLHALPPHDPYLPEKPFLGRLGDLDKYPDLRNADALGEYEAEDQGKVDVLRKRYDEFIMYCDKVFKEFIDNLSKTTDMSNTIIILTSDHGESFSHGLQGHLGGQLYDPLVHIPLIVKFPGGAHSRTVDTPVEQTDIAPTILELAGIPEPEWMEGRSLVAAIKGKQAEPRPVYSSLLIKNHSFSNPITKGLVAVWDGDYKLIHYLAEDKQELFNLKIDHREMNNIIGEEPEVSQRLKMLIDNKLDGANERITRSVTE